MMSSYTPQATKLTLDIAYTLTAASYTIIATRTLLRRLNHERFQIDDYLMLFATIFYAFDTACYPIAASANNPPVLALLMEV